MADSGLPLEHAGFGPFAQYTPTFGAYSMHVLSWGRFRIGVAGPRSPWRALTLDHRSDRTRHKLRWHDLVNSDVRDRTAGHAGVHRLAVLDDRGTTARLDHREAGRSVVAGSGRDHPDRAAIERRHCRAEQDIDRWPVAVFARAEREANVPVLDREMVVGRSDEDDPLTEPLAVTGRRHGRDPARPRMCAGMLGLPGAKWSTMQIAARRSAGSPLTTRVRTSTPPAEAPITTRSRCPSDRSWIRSPFAATAYAQPGSSTTFSGVNPKRDSRPRDESRGRRRSNRHEDRCRLAEGSRP